MNEKRKKTTSKVVPLRPDQDRIPPIATYFGTVTGHSDAGIVIDYPGNTLGPLPARSAVKLSREEIADLIESRSAVLLTFELDRPDRPILLGLTQPIPSARAAEGEAVQGDVVLVQGTDRIELRCGKAWVGATERSRVSEIAANVFVEDRE